MAEWSELFFNNRALISDYYLIERLPIRPEWREDPRSDYRMVSSLLADVRQRFSGQSVKKIRQELLEPIFQTLGWTFEHGKSAHDGGVQPDYWQKTLAGQRLPCLVYTWDRALDGIIVIG